MEIKAYMVSGCGVSALVYDMESTIYWVQMIIERGGVPEFKEIKGGNAGVNNEITY